MMNRTHNAALRALILTCTCVLFVPPAISQEARDPQLLVKLDGKELRGFQDLMSHVRSAGPPLTQKQADDLITVNTVKLRRGATVQLSVFLLQANGTLKDITLDPNLHVSSTLDQVQYSKGHLLAIPVPGWNDPQFAGQIDLYVDFAQPGEKSQETWDQFPLDISE